MHRTHRSRPKTDPLCTIPCRAKNRSRRKCQNRQDAQAGRHEGRSNGAGRSNRLSAKMDWSHFFYVDCHRVIAVTIGDLNPVPRMDCCIDSLGNARMFFILDAKWWYWHSKMDEQDLERIAFISHHGPHRFTPMPFSKKNAPSTFQRPIDVILFSDLGHFALYTLTMSSAYCKTRASPLTTFERC